MWLVIELFSEIQGTPMRPIVLSIIAAVVLAFIVVQVHGAVHINADLKVDGLVAAKAAQSQ